MKQKKQTECVPPSGTMTAKNGRLMFFCHCAECGIKKTRFMKTKKLVDPPLAGGGGGDAPKVAVLQHLEKLREKLRKKLQK